MNKIFILSLSLISIASFADEAILIPKVACTKVKNAEFIFSANERQYLGKSKVACAQKIIADTQTLRALAKNFKVEKNPELELMTQDRQGDPLSQEQWGISNTGLSQSFTIDDITSLQIPGIIGQDVGINGTVEPELGEKIKVAILDTGIDLEHPDLKEQILTKQGECDAYRDFQACLKVSTLKECQKKFATKDTDNNGYAMDCHGWNVTGKVNPVTRVMGDSDVQDKIGHGTHLAGIIGAKRNNIGVRGVLQHVTLIPIKVLTSSPGRTERPMSDSPVPFPAETQLGPLKTYADIFARGLLYAIRSGAQIVNMSLGWPYAVDSELMRAMIKLAQEKNILLVAAAGNDSTSVPLFPCFYSGVICVGSHNSDGSFSTFSNFGTNVDVLAPGQHILSTYPMSIRPNEVNEDFGYEYDQGTSMAAPFVAGVLARLLESGFSPDEAVARMMSSTRAPLKSRVKGFNHYDKFSLRGAIDFKRSLEITPRPLIIPADKGIKTKVWDGKTQEFAVTLNLKNSWVKAEDITLKLKLLGDANYFLKLKQEELAFGSLDFKETKAIAVSLQILQKEMASEHLINVEIYEKGQLLDQFKWQLEIVSDLKSHTDASEKVVNLLSTFEVGERTKIRTMTGINGSYFLMNDDGDQIDFSVMRENKDSYDMEKSGSLPALDGELLDIVSLERNTALVLKGKDAEHDGKLFIKVLMLDENLQLIKTLKAIGDDAPLSSDLNWLKTKDGFVPVWLAYGKDFNPAPFDPWNPNPEPVRDIFIYSMTDKTPCNLVLDFKDYFLVTMLPQSKTEMQQGKLTFLVAKGDDYEFEFGLADYSDGKLSEIRPLTFNQFHMIGGLVASSVLGDSNMTSFSDDAHVTYVDKTSAKGTSYKVKPSNPMGQIQKIFGVYKTVTHLGAFTQTQYELEYQDFLTKKVLYTSLKRFSFMPNYFFDKFFFSILVGQTPGIYVPGGLGTSLTSEVIMPYKINDKVSLIRPARLRILSSENCSELNPVTESGVTSLVYFCQNKMLKLPLAGL